jgi:hypothetical protein
MGKKTVRCHIRNQLIQVMASISISTLILVSCNMYPEMLSDRALLTGLPCDTPCWQNITPGITTHTQALAILENSPYILGGSIKQSGTQEQGGCLWEWRLPGRRQQPGLTWKNEVVNEISLGLTYQISVEQVVSKYGLPEALDITQGGVPEHPYWIIFLFYPKIGLQVTAYTSEGNDSLEPSTNVGTVEFYTPTTLQNRIRDIYGISPEANKLVSNINELMRPWRGYGPLFKVYYNSPDDLHYEP